MLTQLMCTMTRKGHPVAGRPAPTTTYGSVKITLLSDGMVHVEQSPTVKAKPLTPKAYALSGFGDDEAEQAFVDLIAMANRK